jgi:hypothetical protein
VIQHSANNKEDLKRIYLATKTVGGHIYLMLSWCGSRRTAPRTRRIGFEFNAGNTACGSGSDGLVHRSVDTAAVGDNSDMLIVYDFDTSSGPTIRLLRWHTSGSCDAGGTASVGTPCWVSSGQLASGIAEAKVNTASTVNDTVAPSNETLGIVEFGEAGIDLTAAGVFTSGTCQSFGTVYGVSRTSAGSANAQMKDLVGPAPFKHPFASSGEPHGARSGSRKRALVPTTLAGLSGKCGGDGDSQVHDQQGGQNNVSTHDFSLRCGSEKELLRRCATKVILGLRFDRPCLWLLEPRIP